MLNVSPGVYSKFLELKRYLQSVSGTIGFICIHSKKGPDRELIKTNAEDFYKTFGEPDYNYGGKDFGQAMYIASNFLKNSNDLYVVRITQEDATYSNVIISYDASTKLAYPTSLEDIKDNDSIKNAFASTLGDLEEGLATSEVRIIPDIIGSNYIDGITSLNDTELNVGDVVGQYSDENDNLIIIQIDPSVDTEVLINETVDITVSFGTFPTTSLLNLLNLEYNQTNIDNSINNRNLIQGTVTSVESGVIDPGDIVTVDHGTEEELSWGEDIDLTISRGESPIGTTTVPDITDTDLDSAVDSLTTNNLLIGDVNPEYDESNDVGIITDQDPVATTSVSMFSNVDVDISLGEDLRTEVGELPGEVYNNTIIQSEIYDQNLIQGDVSKVSTDEVDPGKIYSIDYIIDDEYDEYGSEDYGIEMVPSYPELLYTETPPTIDHTGWTAISNVTELQDMRLDLAGNYYLTQDIDGTETAGWNGGLGFAPVGNASTKFTGQFDGNGYTISNITINRPNNDFLGGLFGYINTATITNTTITGTNITGQDILGGFIGYVVNSTVSYCNTHSTTILVTNPGNVGYAAGMSGLISGSNTEIHHCKTENMTITSNGQGKLGGFVGGADGSAIIYDCEAKDGTLTCDEYAGGFVGSLNGVDNISKCSAINVNITTTKLASLAISGGFAGYVSYDDVVVDCYSTGNVTVASTESSKYVGGFTGYLGNASGQISKCYCTGKVNVDAVTTHVGGFLGESNSGFEVASCYWEKDDYGENWSDYDNSLGAPKTTEELYLEETYTGWNFDTIWVMGEQPVEVVKDILEWGTPIDMEISFGTAIFDTETVPNIIDSNLNSAVGLLEDENLVIGNVTGEYDTTGEYGPEGDYTVFTDNGIILDQDPSESTEVSSFSSVDAIVSLGEDLRTEVGDLPGEIYNESTIQSEIYDQNLIQGDVAKILTDELPPGKIYSITYDIEDDYDEYESESYGDDIPQDAYPFLIGYDNPVPLDHSGWTAVSSLTDLQNMNNVLDGNYYLTQDIDASATSGWNGGLGFDPIGQGTGVLRFTGQFDGNGYTISNLYINRPDMDYVGLFGSIVNATLYRVSLASSSISGDDIMGSIAGAVNNSSMTYCSATSCEVHSDGPTGYAGGLIGTLVGTSTFAYCTGTNLTVTSINGRVAAGVSNINGTVTINDNSVSGTISTDRYAGGFAGLVASAITLERCYSNVDVTTTDSYADSGGFIGYFSGIVDVINCHCSGTVNNVSTSSLRRIGGFIGTLANLSATFTNCYCNGQVTSASNTNVNGFIGSTPNTNITSCYWEKDDYGENWSDYDNGKGTPKTTEELYLEETYIGWDFDTIWTMGEVAGMKDILLWGIPIDMEISFGEQLFINTSVPDILALDLNTAFINLNNNNLFLGNVTGSFVPVEYDYEEYGSGLVISQNPLSDETMDVLTDVDVEVSLGPDLDTVVGDLEDSEFNKTLIDAEIWDNNLILGTVDSAEDESIVVGNVKSQTPSNGLIKDWGSSVDLTISTGSQNFNRALVPDITGELLNEDLMTTIYNNKLKVEENSVSVEYSETVEANRIISQTLTAGTYVEYGTVLGFVISKGTYPQESSYPTSLIGENQSDAINAILNSGFRVDPIDDEEYDYGYTMELEYNDAPIGDVLNSYPNTGTGNWGEKVGLNISKGPDNSDSFRNDCITDPDYEGIPIYTKDDLAKIGNDPDYPLYASYCQMADIEFTAEDFESGGDFYNSGKGWQPIGDPVQYGIGDTPWVGYDKHQFDDRLDYDNTDFFTGTYDGRNYKIKNLYINRPDEDYIGLFSVIYGVDCRLRNIILEDVDITGCNGVGALVGYSKIEDAGEEDYQISNCGSTGAVAGHSWVGGLIGGNRSGVLYFGWSKCSVTGPNVQLIAIPEYDENEDPIINPETGDPNYPFKNAINPVFYGGTVGRTSYITIECFAEGDVSGSYFVGGLIGYQSLSFYIRDSYALGDVSGRDIVGGLIGAEGLAGGDNTDTYQMTDCYSYGTITCSNPGERYSIIGLQEYIRGYGGLVAYSASNANDDEYNDYVINSFYNGDANPDLPYEYAEGDEYDDINLFYSAGESKTESEFANDSSNFGWSNAAWNYDYYVPYLRRLQNTIPNLVGDTYGKTVIYDSTEYKVLRTIEEIQLISNDADYPSSGNYILIQDIDASGYSFTPICPSTDPFTGTFEGNGHTIYGFNFSTSLTGAGLFRFISTGDVKNLIFEDVNVVNSNFSQYGVIAGRINAVGGTIENCHVRSGIMTVNNNVSYVGVICGWNQGNITKCTVGSVTDDATGTYKYQIGSSPNMYATVKIDCVTNNFYIGGICGYNQYIIFSCSASAYVEGTQYVGGVCGANNTSGAFTGIHMSIANGKETGTSDHGGFLGKLTAGTITLIPNVWNNAWGSNDNSLGNSISDATLKDQGTLEETYDFDFKLYYYLDVLEYDYPQIKINFIKALEPAGFYWNTVVYEYNSHYDPGVIIYQEPPAGELHIGYTGINVIISAGPEKSSIIPYSRYTDDYDYDYGILNAYDFNNDGYSDNYITLLENEFLYPGNVSAIFSDETDYYNVDTPAGTIVSDIPFPGDDTDSYIRLYTIEDIQKIGVDDDYPVTGHYLVMNDIDASGVDFEPIGGIGASTAFQGVFDGNGYIIDGLTITKSDYTNGGMFRTNGYALGTNPSTCSGIIKNIILTNINMTFSGNSISIGAICGHNWSNDSVISNCSVLSGTLTGYQNTGGICGWNERGTVKECINMATVSATSSILGGVVGNHCTILSSYNAIIENCYNFGYIDNPETTYANKGGVLGSGRASTGTSIIRNCYAANEWSHPDTYTRGVVGYNSTFGNASVTDCFWDSDVSTIVSSEYGTPKTTAQMKTASTFSAWDTDIWDLTDGYYPELLNSERDINQAHQYPGTQIDFNISLGASTLFTTGIEIPNIVGETMNSGITALDNEGFAVGDITFVFDDIANAGMILSQDPEYIEYESYPLGTTVDLTISKGPDNSLTVIPDIVGEPHNQDTIDILNNAGLLVSGATWIESVETTGTILNIEHDYDQYEEYGIEVPVGTRIDLIVSKGTDITLTSIIPNLIGETIASAISLIDINNFKIGNVVFEFSDEYDIGIVFNQTPSPTEEHNRGTEIDLWISKGTEFFATVPDIVGLMHTQPTIDILNNAKLLISENTIWVESETEPGTILSVDDSYEYMDILPVGTKLELTISKGTIETTSILTDLSGMTISQVVDEIISLDFNIGDATFEFNDTYDIGEVITQDPSPGEYDKGTSIDLTISKGTEFFATVPNLVGEIFNQTSIDTLNTSKLLVNNTTEWVIDSADPGIILIQDAAAASEVAVGSKVNFTVSKGTTELQSVLPDLTGMSIATAISTVNALLFEVTNIIFNYNNSYDIGVVYNQSVPPGIHEKGTTIVLTVSKGEEPIVIVPNLVGQIHNNSIKTTLENLKLLLSENTVWVYNNQPFGTVLSQNPAAGTTTTIGTEITLTISKGIEEQYIVSGTCILMFVGKGRGAEYNNYKIGLKSHPNPFYYEQRIYILDIYKKQEEQTWDEEMQSYIDNFSIIESYTISFDPNLVDDENESMFIQDVVNNNSSNIEVICNRETFEIIVREEEESGEIVDWSEFFVERQYDNYGNILYDPFDSTGNTYLVVNTPIQFKYGSNGSFDEIEEREQWREHMIEQFVLGYSGQLKKMKTGDVLDQDIGDLYVDEILDTDDHYFNLVFDAGFPKDVKDSIAYLSKDLRKDCISIIDNGDNPNAAASLRRRTIYNYNSIYCAIYDGYTLIKDEFSNKNIWITPIYHVANIIPYVDKVYDKWGSACGRNRSSLDSVKSVRYSPRSNEREELYKNQINSIVKENNSFIIWNELTTSKKRSALQSLNSVRVILYIKRALEQFAKNYVFNLNNGDIHKEIESNISRFLLATKNLRGIYKYSVNVGATEYEIKNKMIHIDVVLDMTELLEQIHLNFFIK